MLYQLNPPTIPKMMDRMDYTKMLGSGIGYFKDLYLNKNPLEEINPAFYLKKENKNYL